MSFKASISDITTLNNSFDKGVLEIGYWGKNRNKTSISKESYEAAIPSMFNCPIVCNYSRETDSIGGHDVDVVSDDNGNLKMINITQPVGVVPESAHQWWMTKIDNGEEHEYLCTDILIWKRQEAYDRIKDNKITNESMEITINKGHLGKDGYYVIEDFEFTAFCLLEDVEPCFESACIELFSRNNFIGEYNKMLEDMKASFKQFTSSNEVDIKLGNSSDNTMKGGINGMNKEELLAKYGVSKDELNFSIDDMTYEELESKLSKLFDGENNDDKDNPDGAGDGQGANPSEPSKDEGNKEKPDGKSKEGKKDTDDDKDNKDKKKNDTFSLTDNAFRDEVRKILSEIKYTDPRWGEEWCKYWFIDSDIEAKKIYVVDDEEGHMYSISFETKGDNIVLDFESKTKVKISYIEWDEGVSEEPDVVAEYSAKLNKFSEKYQLVCDKCKEYEAQAEEFEAMKKEKFAHSANAIFERFSELKGTKEFDQLVEDHDSLSLTEIEDKCYSILGRISKKKEQKQFSLENSTNRIPIDRTYNTNSEPYGGVFEEFGCNK